MTLRVSEVLELATSVVLSCGEFPKEETFIQAVVDHTYYIPCPSQLVNFKEGVNAWHFSAFKDHCVRDPIIPPYPSILCKQFR